MYLLNKYLELVGTTAQGQTTKQDYINWIDSLSPEEQQQLVKEIKTIQGQR